MAPQVTNWEELTWLSEEFHPETGEFCPIPDEDVFPEWPRSKVTLTQAPEELPANVYIKRPSLDSYGVFKEDNDLHLLPKGLMEEAQAMEPFLEALESAIHHLHSLNWAHNDLNPRNILVNEAGMPVLIDFGSSHEIGKKLTTSRGTKGWIDGDMKDYTTSEKRYDTPALAKIRVWLDKQVSDD
ncbi:hypothetical protein ONS95_001509 [Cadophora gregata]|uniref:uncharacterized protein n=1 Tax=Cadophora gregata TaxID=51156 RepID=UPI0026DCCEF5|nr:uncharacterized protein ONS95_001509 [Cadophora gregata]KAK0111133.1 hypothetical protein ONS95_001509 [Cadophora gregata]